MSQIGITRISSKGQLVIPQDMRHGLEEGDKFVVIRNNDQIILKKEKDFQKNISEDLEFAKRTEAAYKRIEAGEFVSVDSENLIEEMNKW